MGRSPCCDKDGVKKGHWTPEEDIILVSYIQEHGPGNWRSVPANTGLKRCSKSCRLRWTNYLRPGIKRGNFTPHEEGMIIHLQALLGKRWAAIASYLPQRTDNDIKNYWNTHLKKKLTHLQQPLGQPQGDTSLHVMAVSSLPTTTTPLAESLALADNFRNSDHDQCLATNLELPYATATTTTATTTAASYGWSMENISMLLEGWMMRSPTPKMIKESNFEVFHESKEGSKADEIDDDDDGQVIYDEGFESILSFENLNAATGNCSSGVYGFDQNAGHLVNLSLIADHSTNWLLDETISASF